MIKFFHLADTHFGVENYGKIDLQTGIHSRLLDFDKALGVCVGKAIEENIDFLVFCGDAYKTATPTPTQQKLFTKQMFRLYDAGIPVIIVVGNHDHPFCFGKSHSLDIFSYLPVEGFHVFSKPDILTLKTKTGHVQIVGIPWPNRSNLIASENHRFKSNSEITSFLSEKVGQIISGLAQQLDPSLPSVLVAHLTVSTGLFSGSEKCAVFGSDPVFLPSQLAIAPFDYVALGHLHRYQNLNNGGTPVVYSGSIERIDLGERKEPKGFCSVEIDYASQGKTCKHDFVEIQARPMIQLEVVLRESIDFTKQIVSEIEKYDLNESIIKILYHIPAGKADTVDHLLLAKTCSMAHCVAAIIPVFKVVARERRAAVQVNMDFSQLLNQYFCSKNIEVSKKNNLIKKVQELQNQLDTLPLD
ncbi:MAG: Nuclease SbcCD, D subunit [candidate division TM6 bacterium GW2011_GWF2_37_49]|nr:MAG: Nuclease SbcCD, D subunit [candidate division TM6 bacterium GW2011_GWF2_37_49]